MDRCQQHTNDGNDCGPSEGKANNEGSVRTASQCHGHILRWVCLSGSGGKQWLDAAEKQNESSITTCFRGQSNRTIGLDTSVGEQWLHVRTSVRDSLSADTTDLESVNNNDRNRDGSGIPMSNHVPSPPRSPSQQFQSQTEKTTQESSQLSLLAYLNQPESQEESRSQMQTEQEPPSLPILDVLPNRERRNKTSHCHHHQGWNDLLSSHAFLCLEPVFIPVGVNQERVLWTVKDTRSPLAEEPQSSELEEYAVELWRSNQASPFWDETAGETQAQMQATHVPLPRRRLIALSHGDAIRIRVQTTTTTHTSKRTAGSSEEGHSPLQSMPTSLADRSPLAQDLATITVQYFESEAKAKETSPATTRISGLAAIEAEASSNQRQGGSTSAPAGVLTGTAKNDQHQTKASKAAARFEDQPNTFCGTTAGTPTTNTAANPMNNTVRSASPRQCQQRTASTADCGTSVAVDSTVNPLQQSLRSTRIELLTRPLATERSKNENDRAQTADVIGDGSQPNGDPGTGVRSLIQVDKRSESQNEARKHQGPPREDKTHKNGTNKIHSLNSRNYQPAIRNKPAISTNDVAPAPLHPRSASLTGAPLPLPSLPFDVVVAAADPPCEQLTQDDAFLLQPRSQTSFLGGVIQLKKNRDEGTDIDKEKPIEGRVPDVAATCVVKNGIENCADVPCTTSVATVKREGADASLDGSMCTQPSKTGGAPKASDCNDANKSPPSNGLAPRFFHDEWEDTDATVSNAISTRMANRSVCSKCNDKNPSHNSSFGEKISNANAELMEKDPNNDDGLACEFENDDDDDDDATIPISVAPPLGYPDTEAKEVTVMNNPHTRSRHSSTFPLLTQPPESPKRTEECGQNKACNRDGATGMPKAYSYTVENRTKSSIEESTQPCFKAEQISELKESCSIYPSDSLNPSVHDPRQGLDTNKKEDEEESEGSENDAQRSQPLLSVDSDKDDFAGEGYKSESLEVGCGTKLNCNNVDVRNSPKDYSRGAKQNSVDRGPMRDTMNETDDETDFGSTGANIAMSTGGSMSPSLVRDTGESILDHHHLEDYSCEMGNTSENQNPTEDDLIDPIDPKPTEDDPKPTEDNIEISSCLSGSTMLEKEMKGLPKSHSSKVFKADREDNSMIRVDSKDQYKAIGEHSIDPKIAEVESKKSPSNSEIEAPKKELTSLEKHICNDGRHRSIGGKVDEAASGDAKKTHNEKINRGPTRKRKSLAVEKRTESIETLPDTNTKGPKTRRTRNRVSPSDDISAVCRDADAVYEKRFMKAIERGVVSLVMSGVEPKNMACVTSFCTMKSLNNEAVKVNVSSTIDSDTTMCVMPTASNNKYEAAARTLKALECSLLGVPIVPLKWIRDCVKAGGIPGIPDQYIRTLPSTLGTRSIKITTGYGVARLAAMRLDDPKSNRELLFQNTYVFLCGVYTNDKKKSIVKLLEQGCAIMVSTSREACLRLKSLMAESLTQQLPEQSNRKKFVLLFGDRGKAVPKSLYKATKEALMGIVDNNKQSPLARAIYVVDSNWVSLSIACAKMLAPTNFRPNDGVDLWHICKDLPE